MQLVTDRGADLLPEQMEGLDIHYTPLRITLEGKTYVSGVDIEPEAFYRMLSETEAFPTTSQPSAGEFAELYRKLAATDPDILSLHISSGLSGTVNAARAGAVMVPEANVTIYDSKTLGSPLGWQVQSAARGLKAGIPLERILAKLDKMRAEVDGMYTLNSLKYLIHGGRISHLKGLMAALLNIKPIIGVDKVTGMYIPYGQEVTLKRALNKMVDRAAQRYGETTPLRVQVLHGNNPEAVEYLQERMKSRLDCVFDGVIHIAVALGAHTGPSMAGMSVGPRALFEDGM